MNLVEQPPATRGPSAGGGRVAAALALATDTRERIACGRWWRDQRHGVR